MTPPRFWSPHNARALSDLCYLLMAADDPGQAMQMAESFLIQHPGERLVTATYGYLLQALGRPEEATRIFAQELVHVFDLGLGSAPDELADLNRRLAQLITEDETLMHSPMSKSTRDGGQTGELDLEEDPALMRLNSLIDDSVRVAADRYIADGFTDHPVLAYASENWNLRAWGTVLKQGGHQTPHMHPLGWLSGVYYVRVPDDMCAVEDHQGWIEFGTPPARHGVAQPPDIAPVQPMEGRLVLFPSWFYHGTRPFESSKSRISIAFDVMPRPEWSPGTL